MTKWVTIKIEWGYICSDLPPFDSFEEACKACKSKQDLGVITEDLYKTIKKERLKK